MPTLTTQAQFVSDLSTSLQDSTNVYWSVAEIRAAIYESLLYWGALTSKWVEKASFPTQTRQPFYLLSSVLSTKRRRTITYSQLQTELQYHLLEETTTGQFGSISLASSLLNARNRFVFESSTPLIFTSVALSTPPQSGIVVLPSSVSLIERLAWVRPNGITSRLRSTDQYQAQASNPAWNLSPGTPFAYTQAEIPDNQIQLIPYPLDTGNLHLIYCESQTSSASTLAVPDELCHATKYQALHSLLSVDGPTADPLRAKYSIERYKQYLDLALFRCVTSIYLNNVPLSVSTIDDLDSSKPFWQTDYGTPSQAAVAYDLLALYKPPASSAFSVTCDVVKSATPITDPDPIPVETEELPYLFDFCRHILSFKLGGQEFLSTLPLYDNFLTGASRRNRLTQLKARYLSPLFDITDKQDQQTTPT